MKRALALTGLAAAAGATPEPLLLGVASGAEGALVGTSGTVLLEGAVPSVVGGGDVLVVGVEGAVVDGPAGAVVVEPGPTTSGRVTGVGT